LFRLFHGLGIANTFETNVRVHSRIEAKRARVVKLRKSKLGQ